LSQQDFVILTSKPLKLQSSNKLKTVLFSAHYESAQLHHVK